MLYVYQVTNWKPTPSGDLDELADQRVSAQSQVLENEDLLDMIFTSICTQTGHEITGESNDIRKKNFLWISLTCKKFFNPAMNILWRSMKSWAPLLRMIPSVLESGGTSAPHSMALYSSLKFLQTTRGVVLAEHFKRFMFYAQRISEFDFTSVAKMKNHSQITPRLYALLEQHRQLNKISFPILQTLMVDLSLMPSDEIHILFLFPTLALAGIRLKWETETDGHVASSFLHILSLRSPNLVNLKLEGRLASDTLDVKHAHNFCRLRDITLDFCYTTWRVLDIRH